MHGDGHSRDAQTGSVPDALGKIVELDVPSVGLVIVGWEVEQETMQVSPGFLMN